MVKTIEFPSGPSARIHSRAYAPGLGRDASGAGLSGTCLASVSDELRMRETSAHPYVVT